MNKYKIIIKNISLSRKLELIFLLILTLVVSISELVSLSAIVPILTIITGGGDGLGERYGWILKNEFTITILSGTNEEIIFLFAFSIITAGFLKLLLVSRSNEYSYVLGAELGALMFNNALNRSYLEHKNSNSSEIIGSVLSKSGSLIGGVILPLLTIASSSVISLSIVIALLLIDYQVTLIAAGTLSLAYMLIAYVNSKNNEKNSKVIANTTSQNIKIIQESLGGIRDIIINNLQLVYSEEFKRNFTEYQRACSRVQNTIIAPRYLVETLAMVSLTVLVYVKSKNGTDREMILPIIGAVAVAAQRLLPLIQSIYASFTSIKSLSENVNDAIQLLMRVEPRKVLVNNNNKEIKKIEIKNITFAYKENTILEDVNLSLQMGEVVCISGESGVGKSTLLDIILGLNPPSKGEMYLNNNKINSEERRFLEGLCSHVPQEIYLADKSILENIAFGVDVSTVDKDLIKKIIKLVELEDVVNKMPDGLYTIVGERGGQLSGGQRQRIGIARALYKKAPVLVMDEATSALDPVTEQKVINNLFNLKNKIIIMITHKKHQIKFSKKYVLENKKLRLIDEI